MITVEHMLWNHKNDILNEINADGSYKFQFEGEVQCDEKFERLSFKGLRKPEVFVIKGSRLTRHHMSRAEHWEWLKKHGLYDYVMQNGGEEFFDRLLENAKTISGMYREQACIITALDEEGNMKIRVPKIGMIDEKTVTEFFDGRLDEHDHLVTDKQPSYGAYTAMNNINHTAIDSTKHVKDGYSLSAVNALHSNIENFQPASAERLPATKNLEKTLSLFEWIRNNRFMTRAEKIDKLKNFVSEYWTEYKVEYKKIKSTFSSIDAGLRFDNEDFI